MIPNVTDAIACTFVCIILLFSAFDRRPNLWPMQRWRIPSVRTSGPGLFEMLLFWHHRPMPLKFAVPHKGGWTAQNKQWGEHNRNVEKKVYREKGKTACKYYTMQCMDDFLFKFKSTTKSIHPPKSNLFGYCPENPFCSFQCQTNANLITGHSMCKCVCMLSVNKSSIFGLIRPPNFFNLFVCLLNLCLCVFFFYVFSPLLCQFAPPFFPALSFDRSFAHATREALP